MMSKRSLWDWLTIKFTLFVTWATNTLYVAYNMVKTGMVSAEDTVHLFVRYFGYLGTVIGVVTILIRFFRTLKNKGTNGD